MRTDVASVLKNHGINPSAQRVAVAEYVLHTADHPSADEVWARVKKHFPHISRATVYNTLHLFVAKGLLRQLVLTEGRVVFDPKTDDHHHFIDEDSGRIHDVPWDAVKVSDLTKLDGFEVREFQVVMRGRRTRRGAAD
jgi:Fur family iron response transcriptional regulator